MKISYSIHEDNIKLRRFEIKSPDYELILDRQVSHMEKPLRPKRYFKKDGIWNSRKSDKDHALIMFTGDITCFGKQFEQAMTEDGYDFNYEFNEIRPVFSKADLVVGNLETMIFPAAPYRTEKHVSEQNYYCNAPIEFLEAIRNAGFDMVTNANNHDLDTGALGIGETIDQIEKHGLIQTGTYKTEKKHFELIRVCGFTIAITAFATEHNNKKCNLSKEGAEFLLQDYSKQKAEEIINEARQAGAEIVFACIHWGVEHKLVQNKIQGRIARELAEVGYDCIIGSHPHVLQPFAIIETHDKKVPVFYSMGNFVSHNALNNKARSIIAVIDLQRTLEGVLLQFSYIPIYTSWEFQNKMYTVIPIFVNARNPRNLQIRSMISRIIGESISPDERFQMKESVENIPDLTSTFRKPFQLNIQNNNDYPKSYIRGNFTYDIYPDHACVTKVEEGVSSIALPDEVLQVPVTEVCENAFADHSTLIKMNLNRKLKYIGKAMFKNCSSLEGIRMGINIIDIREEAFENCVNLAAVVMRDKVQRIGNRAFANCNSLVTAKITSGVKEIADDAFEGSPNVRIYCEEGSYAQHFAERKNIPYTIMTLYEG